MEKENGRKLEIGMFIVTNNKRIEQDSYVQCNAKLQFFLMITDMNICLLFSLLFSFFLCLHTSINHH